MARRSSGGRSSSRGFSMPARKPAPKPAASATTPAPAPAPASASANVAPVSNGSGIGAAVVDGVGWGVGSAIGHRVADAVMGPRVIRHENVSFSAAATEGSAASSGMESLPCAAPIKAFQDCLMENTTNISQCQFLMDQLAECSKRSGSSGLTV